MSAGRNRGLSPEIPNNYGNVSRRGFLQVAAPVAIGLGALVGWLHGETPVKAEVPQGQVWNDPNAPVDPNYISDPNVITRYAGDVLYTEKLDPNLQVADVNMVSDPNTANFRSIVLGDTLHVLAEQGTQSKGYHLAQQIIYANDKTVDSTRASNIIPESTEVRQMRLAEEDASELSNMVKYVGRDGKPIQVDPNKVLYKGIDYDVDAIDPNLTMGKKLEIYANAASGGSCAYVDANGQLVVEKLKERTDKCFDPNQTGQIERHAIQDGLVSLLNQVIQSSDLEGLNFRGLLKYFNDKGFNSLQGTNHLRIDYDNGNSLLVVRNGFKGEETVSVYAFKGDRVGLALDLVLDKENYIKTIVAESPTDIPMARVLSLYSGLTLNAGQRPSAVPQGYNWGTVDDLTLIEVSGVGAKFDGRQISSPIWKGTIKSEVQKVLGTDTISPYGAILVKGRVFSTNGNSIIQKEKFFFTDVFNNKSDTAYNFSVNW